MVETSKGLTEEFRQVDFFDICSRCKISCCQGARPPITQRRKEILDNYLAAQGMKVEDPFTKTDYIFPREDHDGYCVFFDRESRKCLVQPVKPETCVAGPITFDINLKTGKIEWFLKSNKICPLAGFLHVNRKELAKHLNSAKRELQILVQELDGKALLAILKIEEKETFKIGEDGLDPQVLERIGRISKDVGPSGTEETEYYYKW